MTWEQAKQQIAEKRNTTDWPFLMAAYEGVSVHVGEERYTAMVNSAYQDAAELLANNKVKEDRQNILTKIVHVSKALKFVFEDSVLSLPLPFPDPKL